MITLSTRWKDILTPNDVREIFDLPPASLEIKPKFIRIRCEYCGRIAMTYKPTCEGCGAVLRWENNGDSMPKDFLLCDPDKNKYCKKTFCYRNGGECYATTNPYFARYAVGEYGEAPIMANLNKNNQPDKEKYV